MPGRMEFSFSLSRQGAGRIPNRGAGGGPCRLLLLGDFSARPAAERPVLAQRPTHRVDIDNLDAVLRRLAPSLPVEGAALEFTALDDFHPDSLHERLPLLAALRALRRRLADPRQYAQAAAELRAPAPGRPAAAAAPAPAADDLLAQLLGGRPAGVAAAPAAAPATAGLDALIRQLVAPHVVPDHAAAQAADLANVDAATSAQMRELLHAPAFQALEAAWRGVAWLINSLDLDEDLQLHLFDVSRDELLDDLVAAQGQVPRTQAFQALVQRGRDQGGGAGWSSMVALWDFGASVQHIGLLAGLGTLAREAGAPLLAGADLALAGDDSVALAGWQALRRSEVAPWLALAAPGLLLRPPYGPRTDPVTAFAFEEFDGGVPDAPRCLWGCAALAPALLLARAAADGNGGAQAQEGRGPAPGQDIDGLPAVSWRQVGESHLLPVAWPALGEADVHRLQRAGLMPLWAHREQALLRLACWQTIAVASGAAEAPD